MLQIIKTKNICYYWCKDDGFLTRSNDAIREHLMQTHKHDELGTNTIIDDARKYLAEMEP